MRVISWIKACHNLRHQHLEMPTLHQLSSRQQRPLRMGGTVLGKKKKIKA